jgi:hypothetical protein
VLVGVRLVGCVIVLLGHAADDSPRCALRRLAGPDLDCDPFAAGVASMR